MSESLPSPSRVATQAGAIGPHLRMLRLARQLKAQEVAAAAGLSPSQLSKLERSKHEPQWATVVRIYHALGIALREEVIGHEPDNRAA